MPTLLHHQEQGCHLPRILGWDVSGGIANTIVADYWRLVNIFGLEPPGVPFTVYVEPGVGSTYHRRGDTTTFFVGVEDQYSASCTAAVMIKLFATAAANGWEDGTTNGTALTHALVVALHPELGPLLQWLVHGWWSHGTVDYLSTHCADARDPDATGCGLLFLSYLHDSLGWHWPAIVRAGGTSLAVTYATLTGENASHAYSAFMEALRPFVDMAGVLVLPEYGNPWRTRMSAALPHADPCVS